MPWGRWVVPEGWSSAADPQDHFCPDMYPLPSFWAHLMSKHTALPQRLTAPDPPFPSCSGDSSKGRRWGHVWKVRGAFGKHRSCCLCGPCGLSQECKRLRRSGMWGYAPESGSRGEMFHSLSKTSCPPCSAEFPFLCLPQVLTVLPCCRPRPDLPLSLQELHGPPK